MITGSVGKLHDWSKEVDTTGGTAVMWDEKKQEFNPDPNVVFDERKHGWEDIWQCKDNEARARTNKAIREAIDEPSSVEQKGPHSRTGGKLRPRPASSRRTRR